MEKAQKSQTKSRSKTHDLMEMVVKRLPSSGDGVVIEVNNFNNQYYWPVDLEQHLELRSIKNVTISRNAITGTTLTVL